MASEIVIYVFAFGITGLFIYSLLRFGSVKHTWATFTNEELAELKRLHAQAAGAFDRAKPAGAPLYKKRMISHEGLIVYPNGIYAKFCIGQTGKYRFVPFSSISAIYPAEMQNPFTKTDSAWAGLASWKELQVETNDYMVYMIGSRSHDFQVLVPILKGAMGAHWNAVYKEHMPLKGSIIDGPFLRHTFLRGEPRPEPAAAAPVGAVPAGMAPVEFGAPAPQQAAPQPLPEGPGALLAEESPEDMAERCKTLQKGGIIMLLIGSVSLFIGLALSIFLASFYGIVPIVLGVMMFLLGGLFLKVKSKPLPIRMHENGIVIPNLLGNEVFIPYGRINNVTETENFIDGALIMLTTSDGMVTGLRKSNRAFMETFEKIRPKINDARYDIVVKKEIPKAMGGKADLYAYLASTVLGLGFAYVLAFQAYEELTLFTHAFVLVFIWPPMTILMLLFIVRFTRRMPKIVGNKPGWKTPMAIVVAMLLIFFVGQAAMFSIEFPSTSSDGIASMEPEPAASALSGSIYENQPLNITGHVLVKQGESLVLRNCTLRFGGTANKDSSVYVAPGGELTMENCTLESATPGVMYSFEAHGMLWMTDCEVRDVWGDVGNVNYDGGLEIYSDNAVLTRVTVRDAATNGMFAMNSTVRVEDCVFENCADDGLEIKGATVLVANTTISNAGWAMVIDDNAEVTVTGSTVSGCDNGISAEDATLDVNNCTFTGNGEYAIKYSSGCAASLADNTYTGNGMDVSGTSGYEVVMLCNVMVVVDAVICSLMIIHAHKTTSN